MTKELMSPRDINVARAIDAMIRAPFVNAHDRAVQLKELDVKEVGRSCARLHLEKYPLKLKHTKFAPDGSVLEIQEMVWNNATYGQEMRLRGPRKQTAARSAVKIETIDDRRITRVVDKMPLDFGRVESELRPAINVLDLRSTNFATGAKYSGPKKVMRKATDEVQVRALAGAKDKTADLKMRLANLEGQIKKLLVK